MSSKGCNRGRRTAHGDWYVIRHTFGPSTKDVASCLYVGKSRESAENFVKRDICRISDIGFQFETDVPNCLNIVTGYRLGSKGKDICKYVIRRKA